MKRNPEQCTSHGVTGAENKRFCPPPVGRETDQGSLLEARRVMSQVKSKLPHSTGDFLQYIESMISKLEESTPKKITVGVFGKSGVGKSSLINTILGEQDLLPSGSISACTSVIIQVEANTTDANYTAEIDFIPKEEWEEELENFLDVLSRGRENGEEDDGDDDDDNTMTTAHQKIEAIYGGIRPNVTLEELMDVQNFAAIPEFLESSKKTVSCATACELSEVINHFTRSDESGCAQYFWPLVKTVTIKIPTNNDILENIVLIDLPGTGDFNKSRDNMWKKCLSKCSTVWIVNDINRAATDKEPWKILTSCIKDMAHGGECNSMSFICTKTDDINPNGYMRSYKLKEADLNIQALQDSGDHENHLERACILHRNERAKKEVRRTFSRQTEMQAHFKCDADFLKVFTVSSKVFQQRKNVPILSEEDTEIPVLWRLLKNLNNSLHKKSVKDYIQGAYGILSLIQDANSNTPKNMEVKQEVLSTLQQNLTKELNLMKAAFTEHYDSLDLCLSEGVKESEILAPKTADKEVIKTTIKDARGYHRTLKALCENNGFRRLRNGLVIDLNGSLASHMYKHVNKKFQELFPLETSEEVQNSDKSIRGMLHRFSVINSDMAEKYKESPVSLSLTFIKTQKHKVISKIEEDIFQRKKKIYTSLYESIYDTMLPVYAEAATLAGKNSFKIRQDRLVKHIENSKATMFVLAKTALLELCSNMMDFIQNALRDELGDLITHALTIQNWLRLPDITKEMADMQRLTSRFPELQP